MQFVQNDLEPQNFRQRATVAIESLMLATPDISCTTNNMLPSLQYTTYEHKKEVIKTRSGQIDSSSPDLQCSHRHICTHMNSSVHRHMKCCYLLAL